MKHLRIAGLVCLALLAALALGACKRTPTATNTPAPTNRTTNTSQVTMTPLLTDPLGTPGTTDPATDPVSPEPTSVPANASVDGSAVQTLADSVLSVAEVESTVVLRVENVCLAGVTYGDQFKADMSTTVTERIKSCLTQAAADENTVFIVSDNPEVVTDLAVLAQSVNQGEQPANLMSEFDRILRQALA